MTAEHDLTGWIETHFGHTPGDLALFERALTHSSTGRADYERLEFLGDRVLGLTFAAWLYELFPDEPEGKLSRRYNVMVSGETCAEIAREVGLPALVRLGKQARDDGAVDSDNVLGDIVEAMIGALFLDGGLDKVIAFVRSAWADRVHRQTKAPKHPKSALQEWAAAHGCRPPVYTLAGQFGPHHAPKFRVGVTIPTRGSAEAEGSTKQEAETEAAAALLKQLA
ncbi:ribonuclease III [Sphingomonas sp. ID0503]|uniref:ribonuclease III n=1 Tax=Sphingomonas sp. ID0503 TaxID=3399691 RepID=UPI003AFB49E0